MTITSYVTLSRHWELHARIDLLMWSLIHFAVHCNLGSSHNGSILMIWCIHLSRSLFIFQLFRECHCWWTRESPRANVAKFYGRLRLICNLFLKLIEIVISWVYYTIPFCFSFFRHFYALFLNFLNYFVWLRITDEVLVPGMRIWSILLIKSDLKWCMHLSRSLFLYLSTYIGTLIDFVLYLNQNV